MKNKKLYRSCENKMLAGVAGGMGEYFEIDPILIRLIWLILVISGGFGFLLYVIAWIIIPEDPKCKPKTPKEEIKDTADKVASDIKNAAEEGKKDPTSFALIAGFLLIAFGFFLVFQNVIGFNPWNNFWPVILIIIGFVLLYKAQEKKK